MSNHTYISPSATCRLCGVMEDAGSMVKYGVRHHAHPKCAMQKWGSAFFDRLHDWQIMNFPALTAHKFGVLDDLKRRCDVIAAGGKPC